MIAVIDSGSGGANVILECLKYYNYDFIYLVDNKNCPYGDKPIEDVKKIIISNINFLLKKFDIDFIILGCNTASSIIGYEELERIKCPILKTKPDLPSLVKQNGKKLLFATKNTIDNSNYVKYFLLNYNDIKTLYIKSLPKYIDNYLSNVNKENYEKLEKILKKGLFFHKKTKKYLKNTTNIALGCTHFKHIEKEITNCFDKKINYFYCEKNVAKISNFLIKKKKQDFSIKVILTKKDDSFKKSIMDLFL